MPSRRQGSGNPDPQGLPEEGPRGSLPPGTFPDVDTSFAFTRIYTGDRYNEPSICQYLRFLLHGIEPDSYKGAFKMVRGNCQRSPWKDMTSSVAERMAAAAFQLDQDAKNFLTNTLFKGCERDWDTHLSQHPAEANDPKYLLESFKGWTEHSMTQVNEFLTNPDNHKDKGLPSDPCAAASKKFIRGLIEKKRLKMVASFPVESGTTDPADGSSDDAKKPVAKSDPPVSATAAAATANVPSVAAKAPTAAAADSEPPVAMSDSSVSSI